MGGGSGEKEGGADKQWVEGVVRKREVQTNSGWREW